MWKDLSFLFRPLIFLVVKGSRALSLSATRTQHDKTDLAAQMRDHQPEVKGGCSCPDCLGYSLLQQQNTKRQQRPAKRLTLTPNRTPVGGEISFLWLWSSASLAYRVATPFAKGLGSFAHPWVSLCHSVLKKADGEIPDQYDDGLWWGRNFETDGKE